MDGKSRQKKKKKQLTSSAHLDLGKFSKFTRRA